MYLIKHINIESKFNSLNEIREFIKTFVWSHPNRSLTVGQNGNFQVFKMVDKDWQFIGADIFKN
jgi:hypothetical protein